MKPHTHSYKFAQLKSDFEPVQFGATAEETLYRRVEYILSICWCGEGTKKKLTYETEDQLDSHRIDTSDSR